MPLKSTNKNGTQKGPRPKRKVVVPVKPHPIGLLWFGRRNKLTPAPFRRINLGKLPAPLQRAHDFSIGLSNGWVYRDRVRGNITNPLLTGHSGKKHLVLMDNARPRVVLEYEGTDIGTIVRTLQRERTEYDQNGDQYTWSPQKEQAAGLSFSQNLGMNASEFLMCAFIFLHRRSLSAGKKILFDVSHPTTENIQKKYFKPAGIPLSPNLFELDISKGAVKKLLFS